MKIAFQGEPGAYSEAAALEFFEPGAQTIPCETFDDVFNRVDTRECDAGLIPIENSLAGSIHHNYDLLQQRSLTIIGEHFLRVHHCLIGFPGVQMQSLRQVISHPQALAQCEGTLKSMPWIRPEPVYDTAGSVKMVRERGDRSVAAIASRRAADFYGMAVLAEGIEDDPANYTRFLAIAREPVTPGSQAKTSIVFSVANVPGSLYQALSIFALRGLDLTKIESRPLVGKPWDYLFYIDFAGSVEDPPVRQALDELGRKAMILRILGSYPRSPAPNS